MSEKKNHFPPLLPPSQPPGGPGGANYLEGSVQSRLVGKEVKSHLFWLAESFQIPRPLVLFLRGWMAPPSAYQGWIDHLVRSGKIVLYPYHDRRWDLGRGYIDRTLKAIKEALGEIETSEISIDLERTALVGHSSGAWIGASIAALAPLQKLPSPKAVFALQPGRAWSDFGIFYSIPRVDLSQIPPSTLLLTATGKDDHIVDEKDALAIFQGASQIPLSNKNHLVLRSHCRGQYKLLADHLCPLSPPPASLPGLYTYLHRGQLGRAAANFLRRQAPPPLVNALDYYGHWKLFDGLCDAAFDGKHREYALGNTAQQRYMGHWSDGVAVREMEVKY